MEQLDCWCKSRQTDRELVTGRLGSDGHYEALYLTAINIFLRDNNHLHLNLHI